MGWKLKRVFSPLLIALVSVLLVASLFGEAFAAYEDFENDYTEVDDAGRLTLATTRVTWIAMERDDNCRMYKSYGVGTIGDFEHWFDVVISDVEAGDSSTQVLMAGVAMLSQGNGASMTDFHVKVFPTQNTGTDDEYHWRINQRDVGGWKFVEIGINTQTADANVHYCRLLRSGTTVTFDDYSTGNLRIAGGNGDNEHLTNAGAAVDTYEYVITIRSHDSPTSGSDHSTGYLDNYDRAGSGAQDITAVLLEDFNFSSNLEGLKALLFQVGEGFSFSENTIVGREIGVVFSATVHFIEVVGRGIGKSFILPETIHLIESMTPEGLTLVVSFVLSETMKMLTEVSIPLTIIDEFFAALIFGSGAWLFLVVILAIALLVTTVVKYGSFPFFFILLFLGVEYLLNVAQTSNFIYATIIAWGCIPLLIFIEVKRKR